jgi:hypothetical protein
MTEECGLLNIASCLPEKLYDFAINLLNSPIQPLLDLIKSLLTEPVQMNLFAPLWAIVLYIISLFYGILFLYSGFNFMVSGYDAEKRAKAKEWFRNIVLMIVLVQASYFLYVSVVDIGSLLTAGVINLVEDQFFLLTADNLVNVGLQFFFTLTYVLVLLITVLFLTFRYIIVAVGVVFVPIGVFLYFIPPLKSYGRLILNFLGICIFVTFFDSLIFLICSKLLDISLFENFKILVMISSFLISNFLMFYLMFFSAIKSAFKTGGKVAVVGAMAAKYLA